MSAPTTPEVLERARMCLMDIGCSVEMRLTATGVEGIESDATPLEVWRAWFLARGANSDEMRYCADCYTACHPFFINTSVPTCDHPKVWR